MKQPHTERTIEHTDGQQNTGNHNKPGVPGADALGGSRAGAENVEPAGSKANSVEKGTDIDKVPGLDGADAGTKPTGSKTQAPERDEHGRM